MAELQEFVYQVGIVYASIAKKIEELIEVINTQEGNDTDAQVDALAQQITAFLQKIEQSVKVVERSGRKIVMKKKRQDFLHLVKKELDDLRQLKAYVALAKKNPTHQVLLKIRQLSEEVGRTIKGEEVVLGK